MTDLTGQLVAATGLSRRDVRGAIRQEIGVERLMKADAEQLQQALRFTRGWLQQVTQGQSKA
ncbi:hypothetical protein [Streptomyces sp. NPDC051636]|uniref:hypothetical protein n=1 Tax=Streptomyces sp. NPDC051636 TaxID=3365663 RepID=UPI003793CEB8